MLELFHQYDQLMRMGISEQQNGLVQVAEGVEVLTFWCVFD